MLKNERKSISFSAASVIGESVVENYQCSIESDNPKEMNYTSWIADKEAYKANRKTCQQDRAAFEDKMYAIQDTMLSEPKTKN